MIIGGFILTRCPKCKHENTHSDTSLPVNGVQCLTSWRRGNLSWRKNPKIVHLGFYITNDFNCLYFCVNCLFYINNVHRKISTTNLREFLSIIERDFSQRNMYWKCFKMIKWMIVSDLMCSINYKSFSIFYLFHCIISKMFWMDVAKFQKRKYQRNVGINTYFITHFL